MGFDKQNKVSWPVKKCSRKSFRSMPTVIVVVLNPHSEWWETPLWLSVEKGFIVLFYLSERFGRFMCATWNTFKSSAATPCPVQ